MKGLLVILIFFISFFVSILYFAISPRYFNGGKDGLFISRMRAEYQLPGQSSTYLPPSADFESLGQLTPGYYLSSATRCDQISQNSLVVPEAARVMLTGEGRTHLCVSPEEIVIHWSESLTGNIGTHKTLENRDLSCQFAVDETEIWQMLEMYEDAVEVGYCTGTAEHNFKSINIELAGRAFDNFPPPEAELNKALELTCFLLKQYNIPQSSILGHYEISLKKEDPGVKFLVDFKRLVSERCE